MNTDFVVTAGPCRSGLAREGGFEFAEQVDNWMIELAEQTQACKVQVVERWQGVYGSRGPGPFSFLRPARGLRAALMHSGVGMSVGPVMAERNIASVLEEI